jgi:hypothetical protein
MSLARNSEIYMAHYLDFITCSDGPKAGSHQEALSLGANQTAKSIEVHFITTHLAPTKWMPLLADADADELSPLLCIMLPRGQTQDFSLVSEQRYRNYISVTTS